MFSKLPFFTPVTFLRVTKLAYIKKYHFNHNFSKLHIELRLSGIHWTPKHNCEYLFLKNTNLIFHNQLTV